MSDTPELDRLADWEGRIHQRHSTGPLPYLEGDEYPGYFTDGDEHYDVILCMLQARDYCVAHGIDPTGWDEQIQAAITRYRDRYLYRDGGIHGIQGHHVYTHGLTRHYLETGDELSRRAVWDPATSTGIHRLDNGYSPASENEAPYRKIWAIPLQQRELSYKVMGNVDLESLGYAHHDFAEVDVAILLEYVDHFTKTPSERFGVIVRPFMWGLVLRALLAYWFQNRASAVAAIADLVAAIPAAVEASCDSIWANSWWPEGMSVPIAFSGDTWDHGGIKYVYPAGDDPSVAPIAGLSVQTSEAAGVFTGPASLSDIDGFYTFCTIEHAGTGGGWIRAYEGATRKFTVEAQFGGWSIGVGDAFSIQPQGGDDGSGGPAPDDSSPALNGLVAHAYAWAYWWRKVVAGDAAGAARHRLRHAAMSDGQEMSWRYVFSQKEWNQALLMTTSGLAWRAAGDAGAGTTFDPLAPATGAGPLVVAAAATLRLTATAGEVGVLLLPAAARFTLRAVASFASAREVLPPGGHVGRYQLGGEVPLHVQCVAPSGAPAVPAAAPAARVYRDGVFVRAVVLPLDDDPVATGRFRGRLALGDGDAPGRHAVVYQYAAGGQRVVGLDHFDVGPGGDPAGPVLALAVLSRPDADAVLAHLGSGRLASGRTPYLDEGI